jgi:putative SOS response-associated peptidase YedK
MCSYIGIKVSKNEYIKLKKIEKEVGVLATLEIVRSGFDYKNWGIIKATDAKNEIEIVPAHWEFIPPWINNGAELKAARMQGIPLLNATAEKLLSSKMFAPAALQRRCIVPVSFFYEWMHHKTSASKKAIKYPHVISLKDNKIFYLAGIYQPWLNKETGEQKNTFAIVTTKANELMSIIHNTKMRMPVILNEELAHQWILENLSENQITEIASFQIASNDMQAYTIAKDFRTNADPLKAFEYKELSESIIVPIQTSLF